MMPMEGESIEVEFDCSDKTWPNTLHRVLAFCDNRLRDGNLKTLEDSKFYVDESTQATLREKLGEDRFNKLMEVVNIQFPEVHVTDLIKCNDLSVRIRKVTNHRENIAFRLDFSPYDIRKFEETVSQFLQVCDNRQWATNQRDLAAYEHFRSFNPEDQIPMQMVFDVLYYKDTANNVVKRLHGHQVAQTQREAEMIINDETVVND